MKKLCFVFAAAALLGAVTAHATEGTMGGLGFHVGSSPFSGILISSGPATTPTLGIRQWFTPSVGFDLGVGYNVFNSTQGAQRDQWTGFAVEAGLPFVAKRWEHVSFVVRPGFQFGTLEDQDKSAPPTLSTKWTSVGVSGEFEVEWMVADKVSLSASHGLGWNSLKDDATPSTKFTSFGTTGSNFTQLGFHVYLW
ncbi:MAG TPA: outer membrane beta-barrel protein [Candidatus Eisenbacteria bacterium]